MLKHSVNSKLEKLRFHKFKVDKRFNIEKKSSEKERKNILISFYFTLYSLHCSLHFLIPCCLKPRCEL